MEANSQVMSIRLVLSIIVSYVFQVTLVLYRQCWSLLRMIILLARVYIIIDYNNGMCVYVYNDILIHKFMTIMHVIRGTVE